MTFYVHRIHYVHRNVKGFWHQFCQICKNPRNWVYWGKGQEEVRFLLDTYPTMRELSERAGLSNYDFLRHTPLSLPTIKKILDHEPVRRSSIAKALVLLNHKLDTHYTPDDVDAEMM